MSESDFDLIEGSIRGKLSPQQQDEVSRRRRDDEAFRKDYDEIVLMIDAARSVARDKLRKEMGRGRVLGMNPVQIVAIAAGILLVSLAVWWLLGSGDDGLFDKYYGRNTTLSFATSRGTPTEADEAKGNALAAYLKGGNETALKLLQPMVSNDPVDLESAFLSGLCYLDKREFENALSMFNKSEGDSDDVRWYKALTLIALGRNGEARDVLRTISPSGLHATEAMELLQAIDK